jgi:glutathione S-transferase
MSFSEWVEALGWYQQEDVNNVTGTGKEWYYHWKADELKRVNPSALVPTLIPLVLTTTTMDGTTTTTTAATAAATHTDAIIETPDESKAVFESLVAVDYIDAVSGATGQDRLNPEDPFLVARCRIWAEKVNRDCCSPY